MLLCCKYSMGGSSVCSLIKMQSKKSFYHFGTCGGTLVHSTILLCKRCAQSKQLRCLQLLRLGLAEKDSEAEKKQHLPHKHTGWHTPWQHIEMQLVL